MNIIGAGMAGLLAGGMIRGQKVIISEASRSLPNNHSAVLRFRSSVMGDALGIEFKSVQMMKSIHGSYGNPVADNLAYSRKCTGTATLRSIVTAEGGLHKRFVAPENLIDQMAERVNGEIFFNQKIDLGKSSHDSPVISTIPMPALMIALGYKDAPEFKYVHGININTTLNDVDAYVSLYVPSAWSAINRVSLTGNKLTIEISMPGKSHEDVLDFATKTQSVSGQYVAEAKAFLGLEGTGSGDVKVSAQRFSKILPIPEDDRKRFIMWASREFNIYSLGRFATWRPGLLMDDVVNDVRVIQRLISKSSSAYDHMKG